MKIYCESLVESLPPLPGSIACGAMKKTETKTSVALNEIPATIFFFAIANVCEKKQEEVQSTRGGGERRNCRRVVEIDVGEKPSTKSQPRGEKSPRSAGRMAGGAEAAVKHAPWQEVVALLVTPGSFAEWVLVFLCSGFLGFLDSWVLGVLCG